jgi:hypothetical protein
MINAERIARGWSTFACPWVEQASEDPYALGVSDPEAMTVINYDATVDVADQQQPTTGGTFLGPNRPNPFSAHTTFRFRLARPGTAALLVVDAAGRVIRRLSERDFPMGYSTLTWDGRDDRGREVPSGVYFVRLRTTDAQRTRRMLLTR